VLFLDAEAIATVILRLAGRVDAMAPPGSGIGAGHGAQGDDAEQHPHDLASACRGSQDSGQPIELNRIHDGWPSFGPGPSSWLGGNRRDLLNELFT
jgi:hypothetical protein